MSTSKSKNLTRGPEVLMRKGKRTFAGRKRKIAGLCAFVLAGVIGMGAYAFTASNTIPEQTAGAGAKAVTGYTETGYSYTWNAAATEVEGVTMILHGKLIPHDVKVALTPATPTLASEYEDCPAANISTVGTEEYKVVCEFTNPVKNANGDELTVAAVNEGEVVIK